MNKQAYEHMVGLCLSKRAEDMNAPAMVGNFVDPDSTVKNEYAEQLKENANKTIGPELRGDGTPIEANGRTVYKYIPGFRVSFTGNGSKRGPISIGDLRLTRLVQARAGADDLFDSNTVQHNDAQEYLKARGEENHQRYKDGTLWKNEPSKVPMPKTISQPDKIKQLDAVGAGMANARIPGYTKNNIVG